MKLNLWKIKFISCIRNAKAFFHKNLDTLISDILLNISFKKKSFYIPLYKVFSQKYLISSPIDLSTIK